MIIDTKIARAFNKAVTTTLNFNEDGSINWNFVDSDVFMSVKPATGAIFANEGVARSFYEQFDYLVNCFVGEITLADRLAEATELAA